MGFVTPAIKLGVSRKLRSERLAYGKARCKIPCREVCHVLGAVM